MNISKTANQKLNIDIYSERLNLVPSENIQNYNI